MNELPIILPVSLALVRSGPVPERHGAHPSGPATAPTKAVRTEAIPAEATPTETLPTEAIAAEAVRTAPIPTRSVSAVDEPKAGNPARREVKP